ncbi:MAG: 23S rRNA (adenine(2030)-N(6))-methyltransferase RlmJ [Pseudomonadota bacterium]
MLSYQHAYHAGNAADVHKHLLLATLLSSLTRKPRPITMMETHAGRGRYDLSGAESQKTGEAAQGIHAVDCTQEHPYFAALAAERAKHGPEAYPGSPAVTEHLLRNGDRHVLMERHPAEHRALADALTGAEVHHRDGYEGVLALSPPKPLRGMVLIDPSYEVKTEYEAVVTFTHTLVRKWPQAVVMIWYPVLPAGRHIALTEGLKLPLWHSEVAFVPKPERGMTGSGAVVVNAPYGFDAAAKDAVGLARTILVAR